MEHRSVSARSRRSAVRLAGSVAGTVAERRSRDSMGPGDRSSRSCGCRSKREASASPRSSSCSRTQGRAARPLRIRHRRRRAPRPGHPAARDLERLRAALASTPGSRRRCGSDRSAMRQAGASVRSRAASTSAASSSAPSPEPEQRIDRVLGVRHQAEHVSRLVAHAGDVAHRAVAVLRIAQHELARRLQLLVQLLVRVPAALAVLDRDRQLLAQLAAGGEGRCPPLDAEPTSRQTNSRSRFRRSTPGSRPASQRIWKPLQIPSTGPPVGCEAPPRPSPARSARSRRSGGSRRTRSRREARRRRSRAAARSRRATRARHRRRARRAPRRHPGRRSSPGRRAPRPSAGRSRAVDLDLDALDQRVREQLLAHALDLRPASCGSRRRARGRRAGRRARRRRRSRACAASPAPPPPVGRGCPASAARAR